MINKIINFLLVIALSIVNIVIMLTPLMIFALPIFLLFKNSTQHFFYNLGAIILFLISSYMLIYMILDFIFGFTVRAYTKGNIHYKQAGVINGNEAIAAGFDYLKGRFKKPKVELYISQSGEINAYAIGSMRKKAVVITMGLLNQIYNSAEDKKQYVNQIVGILGHEMSHLVNKDFLPGMLVYSNQVISNLLSKIFHNLFYALAKIVWILPVVGETLSFMFINIYKLLNVFIGLFYKLAFKPIYDFVYKWFSRTTEYRCDRDAARIVGGKIMSDALAAIGPGSYFSIFSTHPRTKSRINKVKNIKPRQGPIRASILGNIVNTLAILSLLTMTIYLGSLVKIIDIHNFGIQGIDFSNIYHDITNTIMEIKMKIQQYM